MLEVIKYDWAFKSIPQKFSSFGPYNQVNLYFTTHERQLLITIYLRDNFCPEEGLGGSHQINHMVYSDDINDLESLVNNSSNTLFLCQEVILNYLPYYLKLGKK